ncbi:UNVERIFIED_CONTAM: hypothetical protein FKN15_008615 [Acipenser sinensis]
MGVPWVFLVALSSQLAFVKAEDIVVGCGGFVKSDLEINYSLIEIKLYTKQGSLKYQTDCAPINGYFMIPLYDKGDFVLTIEPPLGWSFDPTSVDLHVDGVTDICTKGEDINFVFTGFSVSGTGDFVLTIEPPLGWSFDPTSVDLHVDGVTDICTKGEDINFVFTGFSVSGTVLSKGQESGPGGVQVSLRKSGDDVDMQTIHTQPGGKYTFSKVLPGNYDIFASHPTWTLQQVPFYRGERITFDVAPSRMEFRVEHDSLKLEPVFRVMGFSVTGRVLNSPGGQGVPDATVNLNDQIKVLTKVDGSFRLENMTTGTYTIRTNKERMFFEPITVKIAPNTPQLPDIITAGFNVCGQISISLLPEGMKQRSRYKVTLTPQGKEKTSSRTVESDPQGAFCFQAKPGEYSIQVSLPESEVKAGLALLPKSLAVSLVDRPLDDLHFTQVMASVSGKVSCLAVCGDLTVTLQPVSRQGEKRSAQLSGKGESIPFSFDSVLPGKYKVSIGQEEWCWKHKSVEVEVLEEDVLGVEFKQTGYMLRCSLSHAITLVSTCKLLPGSAPSILTLTAIRHHVTGVITTDTLMDVTVTIKSSIESEPALVLGPLKSLQEQRQEQQLQEIELRRQERERRGEGEGKESPPVQERAEDLHGPFSYEFSYWARAGEKITVTPSSKELLFYPPEVEATITGENCPGQLVEVEGKAGLFLEGQIHPELEGVEITISEKGAATPLITVATNEGGSYSVGPLHRDLEYSITASKEGFVLSPDEGTHGDFKAFALAGVTFEIKSEDNQPLSGVLLSLSGGQFRSNLLTQDSGVLSFNNLSPGQYYFKPMMKEFRFEPASQSIEVEEGQILNIAITGYKTAYSCYGTVSSLSGDAEQGVSVEAVGQGDCSLYAEDTVTDEEGKFRLRGLLPGCKYLIQLRAEGNDHIERALPQHRAIEVGNSDIEGVNIIAFRQINQFDLSGNVITSTDFLPTLWVKLYKSGNLDNPVQTVSLGQSLFFHFPPLLRDGENYVMMLDSTLSHSQYDFSLPQVSFSSSGYHKHVTLTFNPTRKLPDQDVSQGSYIALPLTLLLLLAAYNHEKVLQSPTVPLILAI